MAQGKKSFIAYVNWRRSINKMTDEQAGKFLKHLFAYVADENPVADDPIVDISFAMIEDQLKSDLKKWEAQREQRVQAGKKSAKVRSTKMNDRSTTVKTRQRKPTVIGNEIVNGVVTVYPSVDGYVSPATAAATILQDDEYMIATRLKSSTKFLKHVLTPNGTGKSPFETHCIQQGKSLRTIDEYKSHLANWSGKRWSELSKASKDKWK